MKILRLVLILFLLAVVVTSGCSKPVTDKGNEPAVNSVSIPMTTGTTVTVLPAGTSVAPEDPVIGTWVSYEYTSWGKVKNVITCRENNTWTRNISNFKNQETEYSHGTWKKERATTYDLLSSLTGVSRIFDYDPTTDNLYDRHDPGFVLTYNRTAEATDPFEPEPVTAAVLPSNILSSKNFSYIVETLDTPVKAAQYTQKKFIFETHGTCTAYPPEKFFRVMKGDCKDYATFFSYLLAEHGFDAKIVTFKYYKGSHRLGHVVTLFTDTDGKMKYATTPDMTLFKEVNSVDDLLAKECNRLGVNSIANYTVIPAGSVDACVV
jgi:hypothetical protein